MPLSGADPARALVTLQQLLAIAAADLRTALTHASNALADALQADKVDAFVYDETRDSLVAVGSSTQPLSDLQRKLGLDVLPVSNGGRVVYVYKTGAVFRGGRLMEDPEELRGVREGLRIQSQLGIPLMIGSRLRGMVMIASQKTDYFTEQDESFARSAVDWVGLVAHRAELVEDIERNALAQGRKAAAEEIVTVLAHDLRNYVAPIASRLYLLHNRAEAKGDADECEHVEAALRAVARLNALIANLLDVTRLDRGLFTLDLEPVDLVALAKGSAGALSTPDHDILVRASQTMVVAADASRLRQCVDNLLANAINHSPRGAPVNIFIGSFELDSGTFGQLEVIDEGPGIAPDMLQQIFEPFVTGRPLHDGLGLGLYIARRVATAHGGELLADSPPEKGSRFVLRIPTYKDASLA